MLDTAASRTCWTQRSAMSERLTVSEYPGCDHRETMLKEEDSFQRVSYPGIVPERKKKCPNGRQGCWGQ